MFTNLEVAFESFDQFFLSFESLLQSIDIIKYSLQRDSSWRRVEEGLSSTNKMGEKETSLTSWIIHGLIAVVIRDANLITVHNMFATG